VNVYVTDIVLKFNIQILMIYTVGENHGKLYNIDCLSYM